MKFADMPYVRPDIAAVNKEFDELTAALKSAADYSEAKAVFLKEQELASRVETLGTLVSIRHSIDTRDEFYDGEDTFWNENTPLIEEYQQKWLRAMLESPFRADFEIEYGNVFFINAELATKTFSPEIIPELQQENDLVTAYNKLIASAQIEFEGGTYTLSQLTPFKNDADDARRLAAWKAEGRWYKENEAELDRIYDELVHLRDAMGRKLGYDGYTEMGYYRMDRNCYGKDDVEKFRAAVREYLVPIADRIFRAQAERIGCDYPLSFADAQLEFRSGNPKPFGDPDEILEAGRKFYEALSPETGAFFRMMLDNDLLDVLSKEGKQAGGYCTGIQDYKVPFIFANFNGTQGDVEVVTHEAGHAFSYYMNTDRLPIETIWAGMEGAEVHSMSMEFFAWPWAESFFGNDTRKFLYSHLAGALKFIPYGTMVDHFQHVVYEKPEMTPVERHAVWKELLGVYMPWLRLDGDIPFYADGEGWQRQLHIYNYPFYYIDYCLAQTVALSFWERIRKEMAESGAEAVSACGSSEADGSGTPKGETAGSTWLRDSWSHYMAYTKQGGSRVFTELLKNAGLDSPFEESTLRGICEAAAKFLDDFDLGGID